MGYEGDLADVIVEEGGSQGEQGEQGEEGEEGDS